ncbi:MAG: DoxX family membrane protein, partial [Acidobacteria bacterium]|nr:DoxX family membrane protein [Acidobacteriota bacterium]
MDERTLSRWPMIAITVLRVAVGWHFLYEGIAKLTAPSWSAAGYLKQARGPFADLFKGLAGNPDLLANADLVTMWGLALVGFCLILGLFTRLASLGGIGFNLLFYLC